MYDARSSYVATSVQTASPARLLTMLCDRLLLDVERAAHALDAQQRPQATQHLAHAQEIVAELIASLDVDGWEGGPGLLSIYTWLHGELLAASAAGDVERVRACARVVEPIARTWREAAERSAREASAPVAGMPVPASGTGLLGVG